MSPPHIDAREGRGRQTPSLGIEAADPVYASERGQRFLWPTLGAAFYQDPAVAEMRLALKAWPYGTGVLDPPPQRGRAAVLYLAADVTYLRTLTGAEPPLAAPAAYERALRADPEFPDAARALVMLGLSQLRVELGPEAQTTFSRVLRDHAASPFVPLAIIGRAAALRLQRRFDEAQQALATLPASSVPGVRCEALEEEGMIARARGDHAAAVVADERLVTSCAASPAIARTAAVRADSLVAIGRRRDARRILLDGAAGRSDDAAVLQLVRAASLARDDGDLDLARSTLERARATRMAEATRPIVEAHLARLDAGTQPERALVTLARLYETAPLGQARFAILAVWVDALLDGRRHLDALDLLSHAEPSATDGVVADLHRRVLATWIGELSAAGEVTEIVTLYARHRTVLDAQASSTTARQVATALVTVGLPEAAMRLLSLHAASAGAEVALPAAELAYDLGRVDVVRRELARLDDVVLAPPLARRRLALERKLAGAEAPEGVPEATGSVGAVESAAARIAQGDEPTVLVAAMGAIDEPLVRRGVDLLAETRPFGRGGDVHAR